MIDGPALMSLNKDQVLQLTNMKVGPSVKIFDLIGQLKPRSAVTNNGASRQALQNSLRWEILFLIVTANFHKYPRTHPYALIDKIDLEEFHFVPLFSPTLMFLLFLSSFFSDFLNCLFSLKQKDEQSELSSLPLWMPIPFHVPMRLGKKSFVGLRWTVMTRLCGELLATAAFIITFFHRMMRSFCLALFPDSLMIENWKTYFHPPFF